jgi:hypothetical protein
MIYEPEFADQARAMCRLGATDEELAEHFQVCVRTIYRWRNTHEAFAEAVVIGKEHADARVERALYSRVVGCTVERTRVFKHAGEDPVSVTYTVHLPPDPVAARHWLRVRQPEKWGIRDEPEEADMSKAILEAFARADERRRAEAGLSDPMPPQQPEPPTPPAQPPSPTPQESRPVAPPESETGREPAPAMVAEPAPAPPPVPVHPDADSPPVPFAASASAVTSAPAPRPLLPLPPFRRGGYG